MMMLASDNYNCGGRTAKAVEKVWLYSSDDQANQWLQTVAERFNFLGIC